MTTKNAIYLPKYFNLAGIAISLLIVTITLINYFWLKNDNSIQGDGSQNYLLFSIDFFYMLSDIFQEHGFSLWSKITRTVQLIGTPPGHDSVYWPNGLNLTTSIFYSFFGKSVFSAKLSLFPYLIVLLYSTYAIGKLMNSVFVGITAAWLVFMYPIIFESSRQFQLDFPLMAMIALDVLFLLKSNEFKNRKYSILLGFSLGWSMLIKGQAVLFMAGPLAIVGYRVLKSTWDKSSKDSVRQWQNGLIVMTVSGLIASVWWGRHIVTAIAAVGEYVVSPFKAVESGYAFHEKYSIERISYHLRALFQYSMGPVFFVVFLAAIAFFLKHKRENKSVLLLAWLLIPIFLFSFIFTGKYIRFLMPILPATALVTSWSIDRIRNNMLKMGVLASLVLFSLVQFYILSYLPQQSRNMRIGSFQLLGIQNEFIGAEYATDPPHKEDLKIKEIAQTIRENIPLNYPVKLGWVTVTTSRPSTVELLYWLRMEDRLLYPIDLIEMHVKFLNQFDTLDFLLFYRPIDNDSLEWPGGEEFRKSLDAKHFNQKIRTFNENYLSQWNQLIKILESAKPNFQLVKKILINETDVFYIYKRIR